MADTIIETTELIVTTFINYNWPETQQTWCKSSGFYMLDASLLSSATGVLLESYLIVCLKSDLMLEKLRIFVLA